MLEPDLNSLSRSPSLKDITLNGVVSIKEVFEAWNKQTEFPQCLVLSDKRRRYLESRVKDPFFVVNWKPALDRIRKSDFCHGNGETGWKANFDWFIRPDTCARIMEGRYDNRTKTKTFVP